MRKAFGLGGLAIVICSFVLVSSTAESRGQQAQQTPDDKLDRILKELGNIEKRPSALEARIPAAAVPPRERALVPPAAVAARRLPDVADKPAPHSSKFHGCDSRGDDGGDEDLNFLKNRIDEADAWTEVDFDSVL